MHNDETIMNRRYMKRTQFNKEATEAAIVVFARVCALAQQSMDVTSLMLQGVAKSAHKRNVPTAKQFEAVRREIKPRQPSYPPPEHLINQGWYKKKSWWEQDDMSDAQWSRDQWSSSGSSGHWYSNEHYHWKSQWPW